MRRGGTARRPGPVVLTYHEVVADRVALTSARTRFVRNRFEGAVTVRTSVGSLSGASLSAAGRAFVLVPGGRTPPPVIWCCTLRGVEIVLAADGRDDAPVAVAAGIDGARVRMLMRDAGGGVRLVSAGPAPDADPDAPDPTLTGVAFPGTPARGTSAIGAGVVAWTDAPGATTLRVATPADTGITGERALPAGGAVLATWADDTGALAVAVRRGARVVVGRVAPGGSALQPAWSGARLPRVALGGGTLVIGDGRAVFASRTGGVRRVARARGPIAAVAADRDRLAWFERLSSGGARRTVARLARVGP